jgi:uncharacterized protein with GYD domain
LHPSVWLFEKALTVSHQRLNMSHYIALVKWTEQGIRTLKGAPRRVENVRKIAQKLGGSMQTYYTMGEYDLVSIVEMPSDEAYNKFALWLGAQGNVRTRSLKAWTAEEASKMIAEIPP